MYRGAAKVKVPGTQALNQLTAAVATDQNQGLRLAGRQGRTSDNRFWRPVLYQLSYTPILSEIIGFYDVQRPMKHFATFFATQRHRLACLMRAALFVNRLGGVALCVRHQVR